TGRNATDSVQHSFLDRAKSSTVRCLRTTVGPKRRYFRDRAYSSTCFLHSTGIAKRRHFRARASIAICFRSCVDYVNSGYLHIVLFTAPHLYKRGELFDTSHTRQLISATVQKSQSGGIFEPVQRQQLVVGAVQAAQVAAVFNTAQICQPICATSQILQSSGVF